MSANIAYLQCHNITKSYAGRTVFADISFTANSGECVGIVGANGAGKSTLLQIISGHVDSDTGTVHRPDDVGIYHQIITWDPQRTIGSIIEETFTVARQTLTLLAQLTEQIAQEPDNVCVQEKYGELLQLSYDHDFWNVDHIWEKYSTQFGLDTLEAHRSVSSLSGGQRARLFLATVLIKKPSLLLLDEPTNHLDPYACDFLADVLKSYPGICLIVSHDRYFLDAVCSRIIDIDPGRTPITQYTGNYSAYVIARQQVRQDWEKQYAQEQDEMRKLSREITQIRNSAHSVKVRTDSDKISHNARKSTHENTVSRLVTARKRQLDTLAHQQVRKPRHMLSFRGQLTSAGPRNQVIVAMRDIEIINNINNTERLTIASLGISAQEKIMITGENGGGKTTLAKLIAGELSPHSGEILRTPGISVGFLHQDDTSIVCDQTVAEYWNDHCGRWGIPITDLGILSRKELSQKLTQLSYGQLRRLHLAQLLANPPQLLILDEPTNHLSLALIEELQAAVAADNRGSIIVITHDRYWQQRWAQRHIIMASGRIISDTVVV